MSVNKRVLSEKCSDRRFNLAFYGVVLRPGSNKTGEPVVPSRNIAVT